MKHAALLATGLVGAVLLIQGTSSLLAAPGALVGGVTFTATSSNTVANGASTSLPLVVAQSTAPTSKSAAPTASSVHATSAGASSGTSADSAPFTQSSSARSGSSLSRDDFSAQSDSTPASGGDVHTQISSWTNNNNATSPTCAVATSGSTAGAPGDVSVDDIPGTNTADMNSFANEYNSLRVADCLQPIPYANIRFSNCLEQRLFWMADDPSSNPYSAWGHTGTAKRSDGVPIVGCDGDLAGGSNFTGADVADSWWNSPDHRSSLFQPSYSGSFANVCIYFALTHGGYNNPGPNEPYSFTRAAAYWGTC